LINCIPTDDMTIEQTVRSRGFGDFRSGRFAWEFANVYRYAKPIPFKGHQGFFFAAYAPGPNNHLIPVTQPN
jgi:hypothetical protein